MIVVADFIIKSENVKSSRKYYKMFCDKCGVDRGYQRKNRHGLGLCRPCVSSTVHSGKSVSIETRIKMKISNHLNNGGVHPLLGKFHTKETKVKLSQAATKQNKNYIAIHVYDGPKGHILMKSSWEVKYASWMDNLGLEWLYEPEFKLSNGYGYLPDFQLSTGDIIEIKGYMREDAQKKWDLFCSDYPQLSKKLVRKNDMKILGLI